MLFRSGIATKTPGCSATFHFARQIGHRHENLRLPKQSSTLLFRPAIATKTPGCSATLNFARQIGHCHENSRLLSNVQVGSSDRLLPQKLEAANQRSTLLFRSGIAAEPVACPRRVIIFPSLSLRVKLVLILCRDIHHLPSWSLCCAPRIIFCRTTRGSSGPEPEERKSLTSSRQ